MEVRFMFTSRAVSGLAMSSLLPGQCWLVQRHVHFVWSLLLDTICTADKLKLRIHQTIST